MCKSNDLQCSANDTRKHEHLSQAFAEQAGTDVLIAAMDALRQAHQSIRCQRAVGISRPGSANNFD